MKQITIFYDNYCPNCTNFSKLVQKLDWLKLIQIKELRNEPIRVQDGHERIAFSPTSAIRQNFKNGKSSIVRVRNAYFAS
jgi:predicted DCC family thiol-disulfide oxidoreductase YuxK